MIGSNGPRRLPLLVLLLGLLPGLGAPGPATAQAQKAPEQLLREADARDLAALDVQLRASDWQGAQTSAAGLVERFRLSSSVLLPGALARLAIAEAGLGRQAEAQRDWETAHGLSQPPLSPGVAASFGAVAEALAARAIRAHDEVPAGVEGLQPGAGTTAPRRLEGALPAVAEARKSIAGPLWAALRGVVETDGRLRQATVRGPSPRFNLAVLEAARSWTFEPARRDGTPVAALYEVVINPPGRKTFAEVFPKAPEVQDVVERLRAGQASDAEKRLRKIWPGTFRSRTSPRNPSGALLALRALFLAGKGEDGEALCLWQGAQGLSPALFDLDLTPFGKAGALLDHHRFGEVRSRRLEESTEAALGPEGGSFQSPRPIPGSMKARPGNDETGGVYLGDGTVVMEAALDEQGSVRDPLVLRIEGETDLLSIPSLSRFCSFRFEPARRAGKPVNVVYLLVLKYEAMKPGTRPAGR